jgi:flagellar protein FliS
MADDYLQTQVLTASPHRLHLMVIDGALRHAARAELSLSAGDFETAHLALNKCREFVAELLSGLDAGPAPELVDRLKNLFLFVYRNLAEADRRRNAALVRDAMKILEMHRETWVDVGRMSANTVTSETPATGRSWVT